MENEIFERDYRGTENKETLSPNEQKIWDYAVESGVFKAYDEAMRKKPKYIVREDKEAYEDLLSRLDFYAMRKHGKIKGIVDYEKYESHIYVELPHFEVCFPIDFALLSDIATKTHNVTFQASEYGGIRLSIRINYFDEIENTENVLTDCIMEDEKLVEMLMEKHEKEKEIILSNPKLSECLEKYGNEMGMTAEEFYDWFEEYFTSHPKDIMETILKEISDKNKEKDSE